jgi:enoyl-CoA hydratase/carnithine racemase
MTIGIERIDGIALLELRRPDQMNAINDAMRTGVPAALRDLDGDPDVRAIVIAGSGTRGFCVGADIKEFREKESAIDFRKRQKASAWIESFDTVSKPLVAALHGYCFGGGTEIALACDIRIASKDAIFALPEVNLGLIPGGGGTQRLPRIVGAGRALDILMTGDRISAEEAYRIGLVTRLSENQESLRSDALALAAKLAEKPPTALAYVKETVRSGGELPLKAGLGLERDLFALLMDSDERREAALAFKEKRKPNFS